MISAHPVDTTTGIEADTVEAAFATVDSRIFVGEPTNIVFPSEHVVAFIVDADFLANTMAAFGSNSANRPIGFVGGIEVTVGEYY